MTYMASCGSDTCDQYDPTNAEWFLIDRKGEYANGTWIQATISAYLKQYLFPFLSDASDT